MAASATCILDTAFGNGAAFLRTWEAFAHNRPEVGLLHYVGLVAPEAWPLAPSADGLPISPSDAGELRLAGSPPQPGRELDLALRALGIAGAPAAGFYRLPFHQGRVLLTLCIGPRAACLTQLQLRANHITLDDQQPWTSTELHRLQALAGRGTTLTWGGIQAPGAQPELDPRLWRPQLQKARHGTFVFDPAWALRNSRRPPSQHFENPGRCTVIGAGISGALVARALALRGWQVTVLEKALAPAAGASGLPAGMVSVSGRSPADPLYSLSRSAYHLTRHLLRSMLKKGVDWEEGGAVYTNLAREPRDKDRVDAFDASNPAPHHDQPSERGLWRPQALWLKPHALVRACLNTPGVDLHCQAQVARLVFDAGVWQAMDAKSQLLAQSELLVLCNALDARQLLMQVSDSNNDVLSGAAQRALAQLHPIYGSISLGPSADLPQRPTLPVHGRGHFLPAVPFAEGMQWLAGAGFESTDGASDAYCHQANLAKAAQLLPELAAPLQAQHDAGQLGLWRGQRCVSHDRLPLVGACSDDGTSSLWMCLAMGARGLTFAALCAELLVARLMGEPLPLPIRLARLLEAQRLHNKSA